MRKFFCCSLLLTLCSIAIVAQKPEMASPPNVALIIREEIKPGMMPAHNKHSAIYARMFNRLQTPNHRIALVPVAGSENEVMYLTGADTFAELESMNKETDRKMSGTTGSTRVELDRLEKELPLLHSGMRDMLCVYRPDLSFGPGVDLPTMRYFAVTIVRVRPGQEDQYAEFVKSMVNAAREKAKAELHIAAFQVIAGMPSTTYMFFRPMKSLAEYDLRIGPKVRDAMSDDQKKQADKMVTESMMSSETSLYSINPEMSYVRKEFAAADPAFWNTKPQVAVRPRPKKRTVAQSPATTGAQQ